MKDKEDGRDRKEEKKSVRERIRHALELEDMTCGGDMLELRGKGDLTVRGCRAILLYSEKEISLRLNKYVLTIKGESLYCSSYYECAVRVEGTILSLEILEGGEK